MTAYSARPMLDPALSHAMHQRNHRRLWRIAIFAGLYLIAEGGAVFVYSALGGVWWAMIVALPLYVLAGASLHGISLFTHEGTHGVLSHHDTLNRWIAMVCAYPVLQTFAAYQVLHLRHHKYLGAIGDPDHYPNYTTWSPLIWAMHWGRLVLGYPAYITAIPVLGFLQGSGRDRLWILFELALLGALIATVLASPIPGYFLIHGWLVPMLIINFMVNIRGMSQHTLLEHETDMVLGSRTLLTGRLVRFFMCNENFHLEHHLYPGVPWYNLPRLHQSLRDELQGRGAPYVSSYSAFVRDFMRASIHRRAMGTVSLRGLGTHSSGKT